MTNEFKQERRLPEFDKDLKRLKKRFRTIEEDLDTLIKVSLSLFHLGGIDQGIVELPELKLSPRKFYKARSFASRSMKGKGKKTGLRLIYKFDDRSAILELIEIYYKGDKENEDRERILRNYK